MIHLLFAIIPKKLYMTLVVVFNFEIDKSKIIYKSISINISKKNNLQIYSCERKR